MRALAGALHGILAAVLREEHSNDGELVAEMDALVLALRLPARSGARQELTRRLRDRARRAGLTASARPGAARPPQEARERMLSSALRLAGDQPTARLSTPQIADGAEVSIDTFLEAFPDPGRCLEEALACSGERLLRIAQRAGEAGADWPQAVRLALAGLLGHLAANPTQARALALVAHRAGPTARARGVELDRALGSALTHGGPTSPRAGPAATGALWHMVRQALIEDRVRLLPACSDHLAYAVLAPAIGAEAALDALGGPASAAARAARRSG